MKTVNFTLILFLLTGFLFIDKPVFAQTPDWAWVRDGQFQTNQSGAVGSDVGTDAAGNVYATGVGYNGISFGASVPALPKGMFLVKYSPQGDPIWAKGVANARSKQLFTDPMGNCYITGTFHDTVYLGGSMLVAQGKADLFVAKFDSSGTVLWAGSAGGQDHTDPFYVNGFDQGLSVGADANGNCYLAAMVFTSDSALATFGSVAIYPFQPTAALMLVHVVAKYSPNGDLEWVERVGNRFTYINKLAVGPQGDIFIIGGYNSQQPPTIAGNIMGSHGNEDIFYARMNSSGSFTWAESFGSPEDDKGEAITVKGQGEVFISGWFKSNMQIGAYNLNGQTGTGIFIAKCDSNGNVTWAGQTIGAGSAYDAGLAADGQGDLYVSFAFNGTITVGQQSIYSNNIGTDIMLMKWSSTGDPVWAVAAKGHDTDYVNGIALSSDQTECYIAGTFYGNLNFGSTTIYNSGSGSNFFLAKLQNLTTSTPSQLDKTAWSVYPNPASKQLFVQMPESEQVEQFKLTNSSGQTVFSKIPDAATGMGLALPDLPQGMYILTVQTRAQVLHKRVVIQ